MLVPVLEAASSRGKISFVVDMDASYSAFYEHALIIISIGLIRSSILVILLFIAFYYLLTKPLIRREDGALHECEWDEALDAAAAGFKRAKETYGRHSVYLDVTLE